MTLCVPDGFPASIQFRIERLIMTMINQIYISFFLDLKQNRRFEYRLREHMEKLIYSHQI